MTKTHNFRLSPSDWSEIYHALGDESTGAKERIYEESLLAEFTDADWLEIYWAAHKKLERLRGGFYGKDSVVREWRKQFEHILSELDEIRVQYIGGEPCE